MAVKSQQWIKDLKKEIKLLSTEMDFGEELQVHPKYCK
jgi:hypothetical protein